MTPRGLRNCRGSLLSLLGINPMEQVTLLNRVTSHPDKVRLDIKVPTKLLYLNLNQRTGTERIGSYSHFIIY